VNEAGIEIFRYICDGHIGSFGILQINGIGESKFICPWYFT
jgi:hypothetical protein